MRSGICTAYTTIIVPMAVKISDTDPRALDGLRRVLHTTARNHKSRALPRKPMHIKIQPVEGNFLFCLTVKKIKPAAAKRQKTVKMTFLTASSLIFSF